MDKEYMIQNLLNRYGTHGLTQEVLEKTIEKVDGRFSYDVMHLSLRVTFSSIYQVNEYFTLNELIASWGNLKIVSEMSGISISNLEKMDPDKPVFGTINRELNVADKIKSNLLSGLVKKR